MPLVTSTYHSPRLLRSGHVATILSSLLPAPAESWTRRDRLELADGDFLDVAWQQVQSSAYSKRSRPLAILSHGLEGSLHSPYIRSMARTLGAAGWDVLAWNYRSCGGTPNRLLRSYHSGESGDLGHVIHHAALTHSNIALIGFSLGGNISLKYAGEALPHPYVRAAVAISAPVDLASSARALDHRRGNRLYLHRFLKTLLAKATAKAHQFPGSIDPARLTKIRTIRDFDEYVTAPLHGFAGAEDYWARASSLPHLTNIRVPALLLNAQNDPLLDRPSFPSAAALENHGFHLETPSHGGHVGFPDFRPSWQPWHERRMLEFLESSHTESSYSQSSHHRSA